MQIRLLRTFRLLAALALLLAACSRQPITPAPTTATPAANPRAASIGEIINLVEVRASGVDTFAPAALGFQLGSGGQLQTGTDSSARLDFTDGSIFRVGESTLFTVQDITVPEQGLQARLQLTFGRLWVSLSGGQMEAETPLGVASVRGSFALIAYNPGDPDDPEDDLLLVDCLEGACGALGEQRDERVGSLERIVITRAGSLRFTLTADDVGNFTNLNPEVAAALIATLTALPPTPVPPSATAPATATPAPSDTPAPKPTGVALSTAAPSLTPSLTPSATPAPPTATSAPSVRILGLHTVRAGETLFCIGRGYGVLPTAIAAVNGVVQIDVGQILRIPAVPWSPIPPGPVCAPQFPAPGFVGLPVTTATPTRTAAPTLSATPTCPNGEFFDPFIGRCRLPDTPVPGQSATPTPIPPTKTSTAVPTALPTALPTASATATGSPVPPTFTPTASATVTPAPPTLTPTSTATPTPVTPTLTPTPTLSPTPDVMGPFISNLAVNPTSFTFTGTPPPPACNVTFEALIIDSAGVANGTTFPRPQVDWAGSYLGTGFTAGSAPMSFDSVSGKFKTTTSVRIPSGGVLSWTVSAWDSLGNQSGPVTGMPNVTVDFTDPCP